METIQPLLEQAAKASRIIRRVSDDDRKRLLEVIAVGIKENSEKIIAENKKDLDRMPDTDPKKDRLLLNTARIDDLVTSLIDIANLPDPTNQVQVDKTMPNGLHIQKKSVPLGVVGVIYESRPNVTVDVAALCLRSGNVCVLRGGTDAFYSNTILVSIIQDALKQLDLDVNIVQLLPTDRKYMPEFLSAKQYVDILIPRGSQQLIDYVREHADVPVIETGAGVCHTYVEQTADLQSAAEIVTNAKVTRPSVCNALDTVLVDNTVATPFLSLLAPMLTNFNVEIFADEPSFKILSGLEYPYLVAASEEDFGREFLDFKCSIKTVENADEALDHIAKYSSKHSEAIVSKNAEICERFLNEVDAAAVYTNASTRFTDGGVFGLGAEIGISTQKLHARGPFALEKLVTEKWFVKGEGQVR
ncbi:MAG: gamma-glutamyl phosphate reductase [Sphingobacteriales bacterium]|nr:gamma-glutamyl phosphate reductase [Sphingobacteriales bacterium]